MNGPKVEIKAAPHIGNNMECIWLYAGTSEYPTILIQIFLTVIIR